MEYSFKAKIVYGGYHVFKGTTWNNVKEEKPTCFKKTLILTHVQSVRKINFLTPGKRWDISREKFLVMFFILSRQKVVL